MHSTLSSTATFAMFCATPVAALRRISSARDCRKSWPVCNMTRAEVEMMAELKLCKSSARWSWRECGAQ